MITFEPGITDEDNEQRNLANVAVTAWVWLRPDVWRSRKVAKKELAASPMYATWDPSVFDLFMVCRNNERHFNHTDVSFQEHAIIPHPASRHARPFKFPGVITALSKDHHAVRQFLWISHIFSGTHGSPSVRL
jgi:hypothetical protein